MKNNLQVVASLLNIHGRSADQPEARGRLCGDRPAGRRFVGRPPQPFRGGRGKPRHRASAAAGGTGRRPCASGPRRGARPRSSSTSTAFTRPRTWPSPPPSCHRDRRVRDARPAERSDRDRAAARASELTARLTIQQCADAREGTRTTRASPVRADHRRPGAAAALPARRKLGRYSVDFRFSGADERPAIMRRAVEKIFLKARNRPKSGRYALWIVTFCPPALAIRLNGPGTANPPPPPVALPGPHFLGSSSL